jgi:hypothetical protein
MKLHALAHSEGEAEAGGVVEV